MQIEVLEKARKRLNELEKEIKEEIGETEKPLHVEAGMQNFPGETRSKTALYRKLSRAEKLLSDAKDEETTKEAADKLDEASKIMNQEDQAHITEEGLEELKEFAREVNQEREKLLDT